MEEEVSSGDTASVAEPSEQLAALTAERDQLQDLVMRRQAEFENFRKRSSASRWSLPNTPAWKRFGHCCRVWTISSAR